MRNILKNISALGQRTHLKLGELSSLFIVYNITIRCMVLDFIFYCLTVNTIYLQMNFVKCLGGFRLAHILVMQNLVFYTSF